MSLQSQTLLVLVVGAACCVFVWRVTRALGLLPRSAVRAAAVALAFSPGFLVGHGAAIIPVVLLPMFVTDPRYLAAFGLMPLLVVWVLAFVTLLVFGFIRSRRHTRA